MVFPLFLETSILEIGDVPNIFLWLVGNQMNQFHQFQKVIKQGIPIHPKPSKNDSKVQLCLGKTFKNNSLAKGLTFSGKLNIQNTFSQQVKLEPENIPYKKYLPKRGVWLDV